MVSWTGCIIILRSSVYVSLFPHFKLICLLYKLVLPPIHYRIYILILFQFARHFDIAAHTMSHLAILANIL